MRNHTKKTKKPSVGTFPDTFPSPCFAAVATGLRSRGTGPGFWSDPKLLWIAGCCYQDQSSVKGCQSGVFAKSSRRWSRLWLYFILFWNGLKFGHQKPDLVLESSNRLASPVTDPPIKPAAIWVSHISTIPTTVTNSCYMCVHILPVLNEYWYLNEKYVM